MTTSNLPLTTFKVLCSLPAHIFYEPIQSELSNRTSFYFLPIVDVQHGTDLMIHRNLKDKNNSFFEVFRVTRRVVSEEDRDLIGFLFMSKFPSDTLTTSIMAFSGSWRSTLKKDNGTNPLQQGELILIMKNEHFYLYHATSKVSMVTCGSVDEKLNAFLTCI